ncbi:hypothetical protein Aph01nite_35050 [Acrocarpospora phusangensis]|uniref:Uncharacterized protein n=1 Tax=Acrocarpospora phusangensis TaxID=1070424 RepID=A0A919QER5_9ACTN|nr:hypothetical protein Aph01nite_35050 [Acrocarpospora phusangensis]
MAPNDTIVPQARCVPRIRPRRLAGADRAANSTPPTASATWLPITTKATTTIAITLECYAA